MDRDESMGRSVSADGSVWSEGGALLGRVDGDGVSSPQVATGGQSLPRWQWRCAQGCDVAVSGYHARRGGRVLCERVRVEAVDPGALLDVSREESEAQDRAATLAFDLAVSRAAAADAAFRMGVGVDPVAARAEATAEAVGAAADVGALQVEWGWSIRDGGPVAVRDEAAALDLAHRHDGSRTWVRAVGPWVRHG